MDIIYKYDLSLTVNNLLERVKKDFSIIFKETIEKYVFLRLSADELHELLKLHYFNSTDEYYFVECIKLWLKYDLKHRLDYAQSLFSLINCGSCNKSIMFQYKQIDTGNCKLNKIIEQIHFKISIFNNNTALVFNPNVGTDDETYYDEESYYNEFHDYDDNYDEYGNYKFTNSHYDEIVDYEDWDEDCMERDY